MYRSVPKSAWRYSIFSETFSHAAYSRPTPATHPTLDRESLAHTNGPHTVTDVPAKAAPPVDNSLEARLVAVEPLTSRSADIVHTIALAGVKPYAWSMNGEYWPQVTPLMLAKGKRVEIDLVSHTFQVIAIDGRPIQGPVRDTVLVMLMGRVRIAFDADNPGRWPFHCHNLYHMMTGMLTEFRYEGIAV